MPASFGKHSTKRGHELKSFGKLKLQAYHASIEKTAENYGSFVALALGFI
jgi:hypothetical protein